MTTNDAAERLRDAMGTRLVSSPSGQPMPAVDLLDAALAAEWGRGMAEGVSVGRRATVKRIREALIDPQWEGDITAILDAEAER